LDSYQKRVQQLYFLPWSPRHSSPINTSGFEGWKQEFWKQTFSQVKIIATYKTLHKQNTLILIFINLQNILVLINHNQINLEVSGPKLIINIGILFYSILTASRTFWSKIKQLHKYLTTVYIQLIILFYHSVLY